ncbi:hypothetical protein N7495_007529 [Penicillium taxi]|uniref:uncharacterized protein n=1 Tax=Penicillium taxi TaxID=168475 RepID=UPI0025453954|nr:uncharacterized protein N7495_007529 [Penicillium taxi]KAJ5887488.1 hypothetical protein N7495_007529 [Penicillium taxi]
MGAIVIPDGYLEPPFEYEGPADGIDPLFDFSCLPTSDPAPRIGSSIATIKQILRDEAKDMTVSKLVRFSNVSLFLDNKTMLPKSSRIFYNKNSRELGILATVEAIIAVRYGLVFPLDWFGSTRVHGTYCAKEPDESFSPGGFPANRTDKWPDVVVEVGVSEGLNCLMNDARWWLANYQGQTQLVIVISIVKDQPNITYRCFNLVQPLMGLRHGRRRYASITRQGMTQTKGADGSVHTNGGPILIKYQELFLHPPGPNDHDLAFPVLAMDKIATKLWKSMGV